MKLIRPDGRSLDALLLTPQHPKAGVVLCHGINSSKDNETHAAIMEKLSKNDIGCLAFDFSGHGQSEGNFMEITLLDFSIDIATAMEYAKQLFSGKKIGIYGASLGGAISILYAAHYPPDLLALKCPIVDLCKSLEAYLQYENPQNEEPLRSAIAIKAPVLVAGMAPLYQQVPYVSTPTCLIGATQDNLIEEHDLIKLSGVLNTKQFLMLPSDHNFTQPQHHEEMVSYITDWFIRGFK